MGKCRNNQKNFGIGLMSKKILITGANGYIGSHIVATILRQKIDVEIITTDLNNANIDKKAKFISYDILNNAKSKSLYADLCCPDVVLHLAWRDGFNHNSTSHIEDLSGHFCFLKNLIDSGCNHIAIAGSFREYGSCNGKVSENHLCVSNNNYSLAKCTLHQAISQYIEDRDVCLQYLRFFTPYGDDELNNSILSKILKWEKEGRESFPFTDGKEQYDYIHIDDLSKQVIATILQTKISGNINICSGKPTMLKEIVEEFVKKKKLKIHPEYGAFVRRGYDSTVIYGDNEKIKKNLGAYDEK